MGKICKIIVFLCAVTLLLFYVNCSGFKSSAISSPTGSSNSSGSNGGSSLPSPGSSPTPAPSPAQIPVVGDFKSIPSNFDTSAWVSGVKGQGYDQWCGPGGENSNARTGDVVGAFRFICLPSHNLYDDPIVYPGKPGLSHLHTFFGNTKANANSTYESLRTTGEGSCEGGPLNRSAYWIPSMMNGKGQVVMPDYTTIYYKRRPKTDPECLRIGSKGCVNIPKGLRMIFGYNMGKAFNDPTQYHAHWMCDNGFNAGGVVEHDTIAEAQCPSTQRVGTSLSTPDCWDGVHLDSADHRSHLSYGSYGDWGYYKCPSTHPYVLPQFTIKAWYTNEGPADTANWYLSSDRMSSMAPLPNGSTFHSDWFGAWDDDIMQEWSDNAIDKLMNCSDGTLGSGRILKRPNGFAWQINPRLVNPPAATAAAATTATSMQGMDHSMMGH